MLTLTHYLLSSSYIIIAALPRRILNIYQENQKEFDYWKETTSASERREHAPEGQGLSAGPEVTPALCWDKRHTAGGHGVQGCGGTSRRELQGPGMGRRQELVKKIIIKKKMRTVSKNR